MVRPEGAPQPARGHAVRMMVGPPAKCLEYLISGNEISGEFFTRPALNGAGVFALYPPPL